MGEGLIKLGNYAHTQRAIYRRPLIVLAMAGLVTQRILWLLALVPLAILYAPIMALIAFGEALVDIPASLWTEAKEAIETLTRNWQGACRVWRAQKVEDTRHDR